MSPAGRRAAVAALCCLLVGAAVAGPASAAPKQATVNAAKASKAGCHTRYVGKSKRSAIVRARAGAMGLVRARLRSRGDWDLAVFDAKTKRYVAGSAAFGGRELAEGFVNKGQRLIVQACRFRGRAKTARVKVSFIAVQAKAGGKTQIVEVSTPSRSDKRRLQGLGLDLTESGTDTSVDVVLHGDADVRTLRAAKFRFRTKIADLAARTRSTLRADRRRARTAQAGSDLPSGRTTYRRLADYELNLKTLAVRYPNLVRPFTLPYRTHLGRDVVGIEIAREAYDLRDGKPIFLNMGVHHAREWPAGEHAIEWAYDLLNNYGESRRTTRLVNETRNIVIPIINPDGFNVSREAPDFPPETEFDQFSYEMKRKNCWPDPQNPGPCEDNATAGSLLGVDPNRNYGGLWGGAGAEVESLGQTFRGTMPFSEPETQNVRWLHSERQITNLITNHTFSNLVLRPPGVVDMGAPLEEPLLEALGARMTSHNGYANGPGYGLYDTTGTTEDWTFWTAGGLGYTFEIGATDFHPPYDTGVVAEYLGRAPAPGAGKGGNQAAYYEMLKSTANARDHSVVAGKAPRGWTLKVRKSFMTATSPVWQDSLGIEIGDAMLFPDSLESELRADGGRFEWHMNPSTRPVVAGRDGRVPIGPPQANIPLANPAGVPAENTGAFPEGPNEAMPFTVQGPPAVDNGRLTVHIEWTNPATDWDLYVTDANGELVTQSASFGDTTEDAVLVDPPPGQYTAYAVNYDQVDGAPVDDWTAGEVQFRSPTPRFEGPKEAWILSCEDKRGRLRASRQVIVDRGDRVNVGDVCKRSFALGAKARPKG
ncbi:MAG: peptidase M14 [Thermoleophilaceae bacterium]|nr:peptidase M14 [Thermoleophilaceae bacterium]